METGPTIAELDSTPDLSGAADIFPDGLDVNPHHSASGAAMSIAFDHVTDTEVEGRVHIAGTNPSHFLVGAFRGIVCP